MLSYAIIVFREVLEIALVIGVLTAATPGLPGRWTWIGTGMGLGVAGSLVVAAFAQRLSEAMEGMGQEVFNASILFIAAVLIGWTVIWMRRHAHQLSQQLREVGHAVTRGEKPLYALSVVTALTVLRDGSELVMFTHGVLASGETPWNMIMGSVLGIVVGVAMGAGIYYGFMTISTRYVFSVTSWALILLAAGMVSQAVGYLNAAGYVPELIYPVWDTSWFVAEGSFFGKILHTLVGYSDRPSATQLIGYLLTLVVIVAILKGYVGRVARRLIGLSKTAAVLIAAVAIPVVFPHEASASKKVYSPIVTKGELEFEVKGIYDFDKREDKGGQQQQQYAIGYGATDRWFTELEGEVEREAGASQYNYTVTAWENILELSEQGQYWLDPGLFLEYEAPAKDRQPGNLEGRLLLEKSTEHFKNTANIIFEQQVGGGREGDLGMGFAWSSRYRLCPFFEPGFEWHADFGGLVGQSAFDNQIHQGGPVFYGLIARHIRYDIGYLWGASKAAPDGELKWNLEFETHF